MNVVKEYVIDKTKVRIHDDYISQENKDTKEMLVSLVINYLKTIMLWVKLLNTYRVDNLSGGLYSSLSDVLPSHYTWRNK